MKTAQFVNNNNIYICGPINKKEDNFTSDRFSKYSIYLSIYLGYFEYAGGRGGKYGEAYPIYFYPSVIIYLFLSIRILSIYLSIYLCIYISRLLRTCVVAGSTERPGTMPGGMRTYRTASQTSRYFCLSVLSVSACLSVCLSLLS